MKRNLFNLVTAVSLLLCLATLFCLLGSFVRSDGFIVFVGHNRIEVRQFRGRISISRGIFPPEAKGRSLSFSWNASAAPSDQDTELLPTPLYAWLGFGYGVHPVYLNVRGQVVDILTQKLTEIQKGLATDPDPGAAAFAEIVKENIERLPKVLSQAQVPHWFLLLLGLPLPIVWFRGWLLARRRIRQGLCPICGYDLPRTPDRCPECGTTSTAVRGAAS